MAAVALAGMVAAGCSGGAPEDAVEPGATEAPTATDAPTPGASPSPSAFETPRRPAFEDPQPDRGQTRDDPLQVGAKAVVGEWGIRLLGYDPDATQEVLDFNAANDPPPEGQVLAVARVEATFLGDGRANAFLELEWALVDDAGTLWTDQDCGVLPDDLASQSGVPSGETANGTICFAVDEGVLDEVVLYLAPLLGDSSTRRWWKAPASGAGAVFVEAQPEPTSGGSDSP